MMNVDIKTLAYMYGVSDMYTHLTVVREDCTPMWAAAGTFRHIVLSMKTNQLMETLGGLF